MLKISGYGTKLYFYQDYQTISGIITALSGRLLLQILEASSLEPLECVKRGLRKVSIQE